MNNKTCRVSREDLTIREYNSLYKIPILIDLPCDEEWYYRTESGDVWEVKKFVGENSKRLDDTLNVIETASKKVKLLNAFGVI